MAQASISCSACASRSAATQAGLALLIGDDHRLGRPGQAVQADHPINLLLGQGDEQVARSDDFIDLWDALGAEGQGGNSLRAADLEDLIDPT